MHFPIHSPPFVTLLCARENLPFTMHPLASCWIWLVRGTGRICESRKKKRDTKVFILCLSSWGMAWLYGCTEGHSSYRVAFSYSIQSCWILRTLLGFIKRIGSHNNLQAGDLGSQWGGSQLGRLMDHFDSLRPKAWKWGWESWVGG